MKKCPYEDAKTRKIDSLECEFLACSKKECPENTLLKGIRICSLDRLEEKYIPSC